MTIRAKAPLRISFGGGGTDVSPYSEERGGAVLSATIDRCAYATIVPNGNRRFEVKSLDYDTSLSFGIDEELIYDGQLDLAKAVLNHFRRENNLSDGLDIFLHNDAPPGSGLGSSSAITVALISAMNEFLRLPQDAYKIAECAVRIERDEVGIQGGKQDQYATAFGGFNFIEFGRNNTVVNSLRLSPEIIDELQYSLVFAYVGGQRFSGHIIERQIDGYRTGNVRAVDAMDRLKELAFEMKNQLLLGHLTDFGVLLNEAWEAKKQMAEGISNEHIDELYSQARAAGALGGKITGAGGGGFMVFMCDPLKRFSVQEALQANGGEIVNLAFVEQGVRSWVV